MNSQQIGQYRACLESDSALSASSIADARLLPRSCGPNEWPFGPHSKHQQLAGLFQFCWDFLASFLDFLTAFRSFGVIVAGFLGSLPVLRSLDMSFAACLVE
jgi:hypothetical protein